MRDFMRVANAGTADANNLYVQNGELNGKPYYESDTREIKWDDDGRWKIGTKSGNVYYMSDDDVETPDLATFNMTGVEDTPYPTVTKANFPDLRIKGAGVSSVNSCYEAYAVVNGFPKYGKKGILPIELEAYIENTGDAWEIHGRPSMPDNPVPQYYYSMDYNAETPDLATTWEADKDGELPLPMFSIGCLRFVSNPSKAVKRN